MCVITYIWFSLVSPFVKLKQTTSRLYIYMNFVKPTKNNGRLFTYDLLSNIYIFITVDQKTLQKRPNKVLKWNESNWQILFLYIFHFLHIRFRFSWVFKTNFSWKLIDSFEVWAAFFQNFLGPLWIHKLLTTIFCFVLILRNWLKNSLKGWLKPWRKGSQ